MKLHPLSHSTSRRPNAGFTLIELLVVVSIIALLAGGSVAAYGKVMNGVKKTTTAKICTEVAGAVSSYFMQYERLPIPNDSGGADVTIDDTGSDGAFLGILAAKGDVKDNPRGMNFIENLQQAKNVNGKYNNGINYEENPEAPTLTDAWGQGFVIIFDADFNGEIDNPELSGSGANNPPQKIRGKKCIMYSPGMDGNPDTWADNPKSW